jgi:hypothetical protein
MNVPWFQVRAPWMGLSSAWRRAPTPPHKISTLLLAPIVETINPTHPAGLVTEPLASSQPVCRNPPGAPVPTHFTLLWNARTASQSPTYQAPTPSLVLSRLPESRTRRLLIPCARPATAHLAHLRPLHLTRLSSPLLSTAGRHLDLVF